MALGLQHQGIDALVFVVLGDGELQEGQVWEGAMSAAHYELGNLCAVVDCNGLQSDDTTESIMGIYPVADKWRSFGWDVHEVDGHDITELLGALAAAKRAVAQPSVLLADTVKGKGVSFMEGVPEWHGSVKISTGEFRRALEELGAGEDEIKRYVDGRFWDS
jgi:transketolase